MPCFNPDHALILRLHIMLISRMRVSNTLKGILMTYMSLDAIVSGWEAGATGPICGGMPGSTATLVLDTGSEPIPSLDPDLPSCVAWVPIRSVFTDNHGNITVASGKRAFSGANAHCAGTLATMDFVSRAPSSASEIMLLAGLVGARNLRPGLGSRVRDAEKQLCQRIGIRSPQDIWHRSNAAPLPPALLRKIMTRDPDNPTYLGRRLRIWHDRVFSEKLGLHLTPTGGGYKGVMTIQDFKQIAGRMGYHANKSGQIRKWRDVQEEDLRALVWEKPRIMIATMFGVSDVAVSKKCAAMKISGPPRGYWQQISSGRDPRPLLEKNAITPPADVCECLEQQFCGSKENKTDSRYAA